jgi:hypothetical protein
MLVLKGELNLNIAFNVAGAVGIGQCTCSANKWLDAWNKQCVDCVASTSPAGLNA